MGVVISILALIVAGMALASLRQIARSLNHIAVELTMLVVETGRKKQ